jgi:hypothetical protein
LTFKFNSYSANDALLLFEIRNVEQGGNGFWLQLGSTADKVVEEIRVLEVDGTEDRIFGWVEAISTTAGHRHDPLFSELRVEVGAREVEAVNVQRRFAVGRAGEVRAVPGTAGARHWAGFVFCKNKFSLLLIQHFKIVYQETANYLVRN